jgi:hypothetical protein
MNSITSCLRRILHHEIQSPAQTIHVGVVDQPVARLLAIGEKLRGVQPVVFDIVP